jgi:tetratricopeptide (TPR) repeat protein
MRNPFIRRVITIIAILGIIIFSTHYIHAKVFALISGTVKSEDGKPIKGATVILIFSEDGTKHELTTDKKGNWRKANLLPGAWTIGFMAEGYEPQNLNVNLSAIRRNKPIDIRLSPIPEHPLKKGDELYEQEKYEEALQEYQKALTENPDLHQTYEKIGLCHYRLDDYDNAIVAFKSMLQKEPDSQETLINMSAIYFQRGELEEGMKYFNKLDEESLTDPNIFYNMGILLFKNRQIDMAIDSLTKCITLAPTYAKGYYQLALVNLNKGNMEEAKKNFQKVIELAPESENAALAKKIIEQIQ